MINIYLSVSYRELVLPLSGLLGPTIGLSWIQVPLSSVMSSFCICFWILILAKYIGNMNADFIHALS